MDLPTIQGAWSELGAWVSQLEPKVVAMTIPASTSHPPTIGMCVSMNPDHRVIATPDYGTRYKTNGECSIVYSGLAVHSFSSPTLVAAAQGGAANQYLLPIHFASFNMTGTFHADEPCSSYNMVCPNQLSAPQTYTTKGTFTQTISDNTLAYTVAWENDKLVVAGVIVNGKPNVTTQFDDGIRSWFEDVGLIDYQMVSANLSGAFESTGFTEDMISLLNKELHGSG